MVYSYLAPVCYAGTPSILERELSPCNLNSLSASGVPLFMCL